jgi:hypothetical protein
MTPEATAMDQLLKAAAAPPPGCRLAGYVSLHPHTQAVLQLTANRAFAQRWVATGALVMPLWVRIPPGPTKPLFDRWRDRA